jgi:hypothetical protein
MATQRVGKKRRRATCFVTVEMLQYSISALEKCEVGKAHDRARVILELRAALNALEKYWEWRDRAEAVQGEVLEGERA